MNAVPIVNFATRYAPKPLVSPAVLITITSPSTNDIVKSMMDQKPHTFLTAALAGPVMLAGPVISEVTVLMVMQRA
jgi:hypothetical protein